MTLCIQLVFSSSSKAASRTSWGLLPFSCHMPLFPVPALLSGAKVTCAVPNYRPTSPAAQRPEPWPIPPPAGHRQNFISENSGEDQTVEDCAEALNFYPVETPQPLCKVGYETYRSEETQRNSSTFGPEVPIRGCPTMGCFFCPCECIHLDG